MARLIITFLLLCGAVHGEKSALVFEEKVTYGDNVTLRCDCKLAKGVYIVWFRNCSHAGQPTLMIRAWNHNRPEDPWKQPADNRYRLEKNDSSNSYDLTIFNVTRADEGFYYCGTSETKVANNGDEAITITCSRVIRKVIVNVSEEHQQIVEKHQDCDLYWTLLLSLCSLCPAVSVLSILLTALVCRQSKKKAKPAPNGKVSGRNRAAKTHSPEDEGVCYAALEIHHSSKRPRREKTTRNPDYSVYSAISTEL